MSEKQLDYETGEVKLLDVKTAYAPLFAKLARVMAKVNRLPKTGWNDYQKYHYASDADVSDLIRPLLASEGVAFFAEMISVERRENKWLCQFSFTFADSENGEIWNCLWWAEADDKTDKGLAKAATSGLKYFLLKNFIIGTGDLADEPDAGPAPEARQEKPKPAPKAETRQTAAEFYATILKSMDYYKHINHVKNTLKKLGYTGFKASAIDEMTQALAAHAQEKEGE